MRSKTKFAGMFAGVTATEIGKFLAKNFLHSGKLRFTEPYFGKTSVSSLEP